ncbi:PQQ-dependent dehydrogenase, methanol/ethanol family [Flagellatimonas centrodinii]|uniref:PQQ-dependent dehydrogenase, methanol/ethanol family n=1 Tax=Flagellatimonas centrodinii TaxID=2806210 RepID=UPI001FEECD4D|nr:PQQ-dependent dehydrogenase, methanol/ethanol family [Flagellatimonas centrodinii]ULQ47631.1 PQQ-dependent dehydrogenase, methanol/ethanol family [Flagellatimonas centrodinii]
MNIHELKPLAIVMAATLLIACGKKEAPATEAAPAAAAEAKVAQVDGARIINADSEPGAWLSHGRTYSEQRFSPLKKVNLENVDELGLAWQYKLDVDRATEATPIVVDGVMYVTGAFSIVSALDPVSGKELWKYDPKVSRDKGRDGCCGVANRGVAVWQGKVYVGAYDGRLIALDAKTGAVAWEVNTVLDANRSYTITGAPRIIKGKVIIGNGGAELGVRGYITAYDSDSGKQLWRFFTVPGDPSKPAEDKAMELALPTWKGDAWWKFGGGGTVWDAMAYDPEMDLLYIGVGNGSSWSREVRSPGGGDNLFLSSIVALKPDSGEYVWHYQTTPGDTWDYTATQHMILADLEIKGEMRKVLMQAPKNGFFYVLDRKTGELLSAEKFAPANWATHVDMETGRPVENPEADWSEKPALVSPGPLGAHNWQPMSFNPDTGLVYIPMQEAVAYFVPNPDEEYGGKGTWHMGSEPIALPEDEKALADAVGAHKGHLVAWDPVAQKEVWRQSYVTVWNGGTLSTAGGLVFQGTADGRFVAYNAANGDKLWETPANTGVMAGPVTYEINGEQYVTVAAGWGGAFPLALGALSEPAKVHPEARVLTYKLGGKATLPPPRNVTLDLPEPPELTASAEVIDQGRTLYNGHCGMCHGPNAISGSVLPDLRYMTPETHKIFTGILAGAYASKGMPSVMDKLDAEQVEAIHQYIIKRAHDVKAVVAQPTS